MSKEYQCVYFDNGKCKKFSDEKYTGLCVEGACVYETPSNGDRIRAMSDKELAYFLSYTWATSARAWQKDTCETLQWLKQTTE